MRKTSTAAIMLGVVLLWPVACLAHGLSLTHYPLGPFPALIVAELWPMILMPPIVILVETFILRMWASELGVKGNLWRVVVLYITARAAEAAVYFSLALAWVAPGWTSSEAETYGSLLLCLVAGLIAKLMMALGLYKRTNVTSKYLVRNIGLSTLAGYFSAVAWCFIVLGGQY